MDSTTLILIAVFALLVVVAALWMRRISWGGSAGYTELTPRARPSVRLDPSAERRLREMVANGQKLAAIKHLRELTGLGLKEAKDYVESLPPAAPTTTASPAMGGGPVATIAHADSSEVEREARAILARGNKIAAIKRVRELTGLGLKEAKDYVESLPTGMPMPIAASTSHASQTDPRDDPEVRALMAAGQKIMAIKRVRELTGMGLKEAKDLVEALPAAQPIATAARTAPVPLANPQNDPEVRALLAAGHKIAAIKRVRELTGLGLKEAKDFVEALAARGDL